MKFLKNDIFEAFYIYLQRKYLRRIFKILSFAFTTGKSALHYWRTGRNFWQGGPFQVKHKTVFTVIRNFLGVVGPFKSRVDARRKKEEHLKRMARPDGVSGPSGSSWPKVRLTIYILYFYTIFFKYKISFS